MTRVVIIGAGVSGLTTALLLSQDERFSITLIAKHMPGDYDIEYASPWAGANYMPFSGPGSIEQVYERQTWPELYRLAKDHPEAGIHFQDCILYKRSKDDGTPTGEWVKHLMNPNAWYKDLVLDYSIIPSDELPPGIDHGQKFTSVCINTALYLPWLASQCLRQKVVLRRGIVEHIKDATKLHHSKEPADIIVNCTGLGSQKLGGVEDNKVYPARGQIVVVRNDPGDVMMDISGTDDGIDEACYIMKRAGGGGTILGGSYQEYATDGVADLDLSDRIMKRCIKLCPALTTNGSGIEGLSIIRHGVGLRPVRKDGVRVERESTESLQIIHNYGHGGGGYQMSYGSAEEAVRLIRLTSTSNVEDLKGSHCSVRGAR